MCACPGEVSNLGAIVHFTTFLYPSESYGRQTLVSLPRENLSLHYISPCTWGNKQGVREVSSSPYQEYTPASPWLGRAQKQLYRSAARPHQRQHPTGPAENE